MRAAESRAAQGVLSSGHEEAARAVRRGWAELRRREEAVAQELLMTHEVVVSTLVGCGTPSPNPDPNPDSDPTPDPDHDPNPDSNPTIDP